MTSGSTGGLWCLRDFGWPFLGAGSSLDFIVARMARLLMMSSSSWTFFSFSAHLRSSR